MIYITYHDEDHAEHKVKWTPEVGTFEHVYLAGVTEVEADREGIFFIDNAFKNLPIPIMTRRATWRGSLAQFIVANLPEPTHG